MGKYVIRPEERPAYTPAGHTGTVNRDLIGKENLGAKHMEITLGTMEAGGVVHAHAHEAEEQALYIIEGKAHIEVEGEREEAQAGDMVFFPQGKMHLITPFETPYKALVIYAPPRGGRAE